MYSFYLIFSILIFVQAELNENQIVYFGLLFDRSERVSSECFDSLNYCKVIFDPQNHIIKISFIFENFNQLKLNCINKKNILISFIRFFATEKQILNDSLSLNLATNKKISLNQSVTIEFYNIQAFEINSKTLFKNISNKYQSISLAFYYSNFDFVKNGSKVQDCSSLMESSFSIKIDRLSFAFSTKYTKLICPVVFRNSKINLISFYGLANCFTKKNMLSFYHANFSIDYSLDSNIQSLFLKIFYGKINLNLVDRKIFQKITQITIKGSIDEIDESILFNLAELNTLYLMLDNLGEFISKSNKWLEYLNLFARNETFFLHLLESIEMDSLLDSDFCFLKPFLHKRIFLLL